MNVISRILGALIAIALAKVGAWLGIEFTDADVQSVTMWAPAALVVLYGAIHPVVRSRLVAWTGKGARAADNVTPPVAPLPPRRLP